MTFHVGIPVFAVAMFSQFAMATPENWWAPLASSGILGPILVWFMWRNEKRLNENTRALNLNTITIAACALDTKHKDAAISELLTKLKADAEEELANAPPPVTRRGR